MASVSLINHRRSDRHLPSGRDANLKRLMKLVGLSISELSRSLKADAIAGYSLDLGRC
jgi:hypothetical protein